MKNDPLTITIPQDEYQKMQTELTELRTLVNYLQTQFRLSQHWRFGAFSEKRAYDAEQLSMQDTFNEAEANADTAVSESELVEVERHFRKRTRLTTDNLPKGLPVETEEHSLPENAQTCPTCNGTLHVMGSDKHRELVIILAQVKIREHIYKTYACWDCEKNGINATIVKTPISEPVIKGGFASPESVAHILTQKYVMGVPLYRQEKELSRNGIKLTRQTMSNWIVKASMDWFEPIYDELHKRLFEHEVAPADETTLQILREPGKKA